MATTFDTPPQEKSQSLSDTVWFRLLMCFGLGAIGALSMPPYTSYALMLSLSVYWIVLTSFEKKWHAFPAGFLFGFGYFLGGIWWVGNALLVGGNPYLWALPLAVSGLQALLALFPMMAAACSQYVARGRSFGAYLFFLAMMGFWEWARGNFFTGFPWNLFGMMWTSNLPMLQILSFGGIYFLSLLTIFMLSVPGFLLAGTLRLSLRVALAVGAVALGIGLSFWGKDRLADHLTSYNQDVVVQVVTPNIPQEKKWEATYFWENYLQTVKAISPAANSSPLTAPTRLIVLPETALQYTIFEDANAVSTLRDTLRAYPEKTYLLTGMLRRTDNAKTGGHSYYNALVGLDQDLTEVMAFDKFHLVPFGEYIPFQKYIPIGPVISFSGFDTGTGPRTITLDDVPPFSPLVCYEVIFPGAVTQKPDNGKTPAPQFIVNVTNDAWYGVSPGPHQHLGHAVYRAIEEGIPVIRSTNTGFSAIIDPYGRVLDKSGLYEQATQTKYLPQPALEKTFYAVWKQGPFFFLLIILIFSFFFTQFRRK